MGLGILARSPSRRRPHVDTILFIPLSAARNNLDANWAEADAEMVRRYSICQCDSIIGHGRRRTVFILAAHDVYGNPADR